MLEEFSLVMPFKGPLPDRAVCGGGKRVEHGHQSIGVTHAEGVNLCGGQPEELGQMKQPPGVPAHRVNRIATWRCGLTVDPDHFGHLDPFVPIALRIDSQEPADAGFKEVR